MQQPSSNEDQLNRRLDRLIQFAGGYFILQATSAGIKNAELRKSVEWQWIGSRG
jgi:hypothetical protein